MLNKMLVFSLLGVRNQNQNKKEFELNRDKLYRLFVIVVVVVFFVISFEKAQLFFGWFRVIIPVRMTARIFLSLAQKIHHHCSYANA